MDQGYKVRGTVRSGQNKERNAKLFALDYVSTHLQLFEANLTSEAGWDEAVQGCDYVLHIASPCQFHSLSNEIESIEPAIKGTRIVAEAAIKHRVKRLVATGSCITITSNRPSGSYTEDGRYTCHIYKATTPNPSYSLEKALWELHKAQTGDHKTEIVVAMPSLLFGPTVIDNKGDLSFSEIVMATFLDGTYAGIPEPDIEHRTVDVRDERACPSTFC